MNTLKLALQPNYSAEDVKSAIEIIGAECFGALSMANSLGGIQTTDWQIIRNNKWADIVAEGKALGLDFASMKCAVTDTPLMRSGHIQQALGMITEEERKAMFYRSVKVNGKWPD